MAKKMTNKEIKKKLSGMYRDKKILTVLGIMILVLSPIAVLPLGSLILSWFPQPTEHCTGDFGQCFSQGLWEVVGPGVGCIFVLLIIDVVIIAMLDGSIDRLESKLPSSSRKSKVKNKKKEYDDPYL